MRVNAKRKAGTSVGFLIFCRYNITDKHCLFHRIFAHDFSHSKKGKKIKKKITMITNKCEKKAITSNFNEITIIHKYKP